MNQLSQPSNQATNYYAASSITDAAAAAAVAIAVAIAAVMTMMMNDVALLCVLIVVVISFVSLKRISISAKIQYTYICI